MNPAIRLEHGDCLEVMKRLHAEGVRVHSAVTDAPYHLTSIVDRLGSPSSAPIQSGATGVYARSSSGFMGQKWDGGDVAFRPETWRLVFDLLHPGGHLIAFSHCRTYHRMACAIEDAGFEIRNMLDWMYGTGFPKSHNLDGEFDGWGTDLKPAKEPIVLARKPIIGSVAANMGMFGTGALNIDGCRIGTEEELKAGAGKLWSHYRTKRLAPGAVQNATGQTHGEEIYEGLSKPGRWPANVVHDGSDEVLGAFAAFGERGAQAPVTRRGSDADGGRQIYNRGFNGNEDPDASTFQGDSGTAARFFYSAKATDGERVYRCTTCGAHQLGKPKCEHETLTSHPTVKPIALMRWLCRLVTPPEGVVLDCFAGTGTTGAAAIAERFSAILIEREDQYIADIKVRCGDSIAERVTGRAVRQLDAGPLFGDAA